MGTTGFDILAIPLPDDRGRTGARLVLASSSTEVDLDSTTCQPFKGELPSGWRGRRANTNGSPPPIILQENSGGTRIRLIETKPYDWALEGPETENLIIQSPLEDNRRQQWSVRKQKNVPPSGSFTVINHLGLSTLEILSTDKEGIVSIPLEFISSKLDFDREYRRMTEDIAEFCEQLLLLWDAPTSLTFSASPDEEARLILEQFLFLRHFLTDERLGRLLEMIERNPHSRLQETRTWIPAAMVRSSQHLSDPQGMLRDWHRSSGRPTPGQAQEVRKEDNRDTPPNRFLKFALNNFRAICNEVSEIRDEHTQTGNEARALLGQLDAILARRFFRDLGPVARLPLNNQTLQKGEGYREVLRAWILTQAAASLNWDGQQDSYQGSSRDVATLYEYWIFIKLHEILEKFPGMIRKSESKDPESFIKEDESGIKLNLKSGKPSLSSFILKTGTERSLCIDLHYERTFTTNRGANSGASYSRNFRPDYTLSIYPEHFGSEKNALEAGQASHLHFDAKYRAEKLDQVFGLESDEELSVEKISGKASGTYKRADLLKMHTYNDALRQTIGSYVLYPGDSDPDEMRKFHEIAPGVGAFVMKPGNEDSLDALKKFLGDIFKHQQSHFTQFRYLAQAGYQTHSESPQILKEEEMEYHVARTKAPCVVMWLRAEKQNTFKDAGFAYCRVSLKDQKKRALNLNLSTEIGSEFIPAQRRQGGRMTGLGWRGKIKTARFLSADGLKTYLEKESKGKIESSEGGESYLLYEFDQITPIQKFDLTGVHNRHKSGSEYMAISCLWEEILENNPSFRPKASGTEKPAS